MTIFAIQNSAPTAVEFLVWKREGMPVSALILISLGAGLVLAGVPLAIQRWRLRARVRTLETRVQDARDGRGGADARGAGTAVRRRGLPPPSG